MKAKNRSSQLLVREIIIGVLLVAVIFLIVVAVQREATTSQVFGTYACEPRDDDSFQFTALHIALFKDKTFHMDNFGKPYKQGTYVKLDTVGDVKNAKYELIDNDNKFVGYILQNGKNLELMNLQDEALEDKNLVIAFSRTSDVPSVVASP